MIFDMTDGYTNCLAPGVPGLLFDWVPGVWSTPASRQEELAAEGRTITVPPVERVYDVPAETR